MDALPYIPIIVEATKFVFNEASKWPEQVRQKAGRAAEQLNTSSPSKPKLTAGEFATLDMTTNNISQLIDLEKAKTFAYEICSLMGVIQIHRRNLLDHEKTESVYAELTPIYVRRAIEREIAYQGFAPELNRQLERERSR